MIEHLRNDSWNLAIGEKCCLIGPMMPEIKRQKLLYEVDTFVREWGEARIQEVIKTLCE